MHFNIMESWPFSPPAGNSDDDKVFVVLTAVVVLLTLLTIVVVLSVLIIICLCYNRSEKTKVTSVDHLPTGNNYLTNAKPTCLVNTVLNVPNRTKRKEHNDNMYV